MIKELALKEREDYLATLKDLVNIETPSNDKVANDQMAEFLKDLLLKDGWDVELIEKSEVGNQVVASIGNAKPSTLILCHFDTVWPIGTLKTMPIIEKDGKVYGPGMMDMKAGITTAIHALRIIKREGLKLKGAVTLLLSSDEEISSHHSKDLIIELAKEHEAVLVLEPSRGDGAVKVGRKGGGGFKVKFKGISAHAGNNPKDGASSIKEMAHFLLFAETLWNYDIGTTVTVNMVKGGFANNVIPEYAEAHVDMRILQMGEEKRIEDAIRAYKPKDERVEIEVLGGLNRPPLEFNDKNKILYAEFEKNAKKLGLEISSAIVGGGSDGNFTSAIGIPTLDGLGCVGVGPHAKHEHIVVDGTLERLALLIAFLTEA
ncbi:MAG TPA: M20 family peptidase [Trueperaceae bacterium]|nr:M20 family peptidase [Trueperaceae bacterium]